MTRRLVVSYLAITMVVLLLLEVPLGIFYGQREEERFIADVERDAVVLASFYEDTLDQGEPADTLPADEYATRTGARVILVDTSGISLLDTDPVPARDFSTRPEVESALAGVRSAGIRRSETLDRDILYVAVPVASGGTVHGALRLTVDAHEVTERIQRLWLGLLAVALVVVVAVAAVGFAIARSVTRPLRELQESTRRFAEGDLTTTPISEDAPSEVRSLGNSINTMAAQLDELIEAQRSFVSDASHQLRTPLTALRLRLENLESRLTKDVDVSEVSATIDEIERLSQLVNGLLQLARAERTPTAAIVDARMIVADRVDTWTAVADEQQICFDLSAPELSTNVLAIPGAIEQMLDNILDNALTVSPPHSTIGVRVTPAVGQTLITVSDQGPGLSDQAKSRALQRFWRGDTSSRGSGLGLAIATKLAEASDGYITLEDNEHGGLTVVISLPTAVSPAGA
ncbi:MAG: HAMP domain-containing protein [Acidimicrobiales bacterium]|nr:HAMP domain-containing protein [Acidimicrobiales bacterium]